MKSKMTQLLLFIMMLSFFGTSKGNNETATVACKMKCIQTIDQQAQGAVDTKPVRDVNVEYPFALTPGSYMLRY